MDAITKRFAYHRPDAAGVETVREVRKAFVGLASFLVEKLPEGREKALALTELQNAMMWANAAQAMTWPEIEEVK